MGDGHGHGHSHDSDEHEHGTLFIDAGPVNMALQSGDRTSPWPHSSDDPTATKTLRSRYSAEMYRRFRSLKGAIRTGIVERNALGELTVEPGRRRPTSGLSKRDVLQAYPIGPPSDPERFPDFDSCVDAIADPPDVTREEARAICGKWQQRIEGEIHSRFADADFEGYQDINIDPPDRNQFDFPSDERKVDRFMEWLERQVGRGILESDVRERSVSAHRQWMNVYIRSAYERGVTHADAALVDAGVIPPGNTLDDVFRAPQHADAAGLIFTRSYRELEGVTDAMGQQISRVLADGITQGWNPRKTAREINDRVDKVGLYRARLIARTETIRAHNEASLNRFQDVAQRIQGVTAIVEFSTAGDSRVCPICLGLEGTTYTIEEARGLIPVHPNCRCAWLPVPETVASPFVPGS